MMQKFLSIPGRYRYMALAGIVLLAAAGIFIALRGRPAPVTDGQQITIQQGQTGQEGPSVDSTDVPFLISLSEGKPQAQEATPMPVTTGDPLPLGEIQSLLARLPALTGQTDDQVDFRLPEDVLPPPRPGETVKESFPPPPEAAQPGAVQSGPLQVLRFAPEGDIEIAPFVSVTFNQPMLALDTLEGLSSQEVPVKITPELPGTWRWLGARTLTFEYDSALIDRLPKATQYRVSVPAGTRSTTGGVLSEAVEWTFSTPPPKAIFTYPSSEPQPREPLFFIGFDQRVNPQDVLDTVRVSAGGQNVAVRMVSQADIEADAKTRGLLKNSQEGRWVAFRAQEPLPPDTQINVTIGPKTPSAEGELVTETAQTYSFSTYAALRIEDHGCSWGGNQCQPLTPFYIRFNNPLDAALFNEDMLSIQPELPGATVNLYGTTLEIRGASKGQTTYTVTLDSKIQDVFGQQLGQTARLTFRVGPAEPSLFGPNSTLVTLDPAAPKPVYSVYALNYNRLDVEIYAVQPSDWPAFMQYMMAFQRNERAANVPGRRVLNTSLPVEAAADAITQVDIDLSEHMDGKFGHFIVIVRPPANLLKNPDEIHWRTVQAWVQITQIGLDAFADHSELVVWATNLRDGAPLANIPIEAAPGGQQITTGADGVARTAIPQGTTHLIGTQGADKALLPRSANYWGGDAWTRSSVYDQLRWYVFDDRQMYRPGEEMHLKGWLRRVGGKQDGDVGLVGDALNAVNYRVSDPQGNDLGGGRAEVNSLGGFDFTFTLPENANLGYASIVLDAEGSPGGMEGLQWVHSFQIQEFRRPEFEVTARNETSGPYFAGGEAVVAVAANYYAGGALPNADVYWWVTSSAGHYAPPNWPKFTFGSWTPWWWYNRYDPFPQGSETIGEEYNGITDAAGEHYLRLDFETDPLQSGKPQPVSVVAQATVTDVNRQAWTGSTTLLVHPANLYIGIRSDKYFVERGQPLNIEYIVTDLDGNPVGDRPVEIRAGRLEWKYVAGNWTEQEADVQVCSAGSKEEPATCTFETPIGGTYRITAEVTDDQGRKNQSQFDRWVSGGQRPPAREVEQEEVTLIPDQESYQPGDVARILVQSPFTPAEGLLTVSRSGLLYTQRFQITDGTITLEVPIEDQHIPNLNIQVDLNGAAERTGDQGEKLEGVPARPAFATGQMTLPIPPTQRALTLELNPAQSELEPGGETNLDITLRDAAGKPVEGAELAVVVVDEAILAMTGYQTPDPLAAFYSERPSYLYGVYGRASIVLADPSALAQGADGALPAATLTMQKNMDMRQGGMIAEAPAMEEADMASGAGAAQPEPIRVRLDFNPLAVFAPSVRTAADGRAQVSIKVPDNLTRYRVMVVAVDGTGKLYGAAESNLVARLPLMVRPSAPRFLNFGDRFELPIVLQNQTNAPLDAQVALRASNLILSGPDPSVDGLRVTIPARDRVEVRFPAAADQAGTARFQVVVTAGDYADAATIDLPVYTPATSEAFATYGVIDEGAVAQPVASPKDVFPQYGGLEITTSSTALQALTDAVLYLVSYPFDCTEQIASRVLGIAALRDVLTAFEAEGLPSPQEMEQSVERDLQTLAGLQNDDGGFPYWRRGQESVPFNTIHTAHALARAGQKGFSVPADMRERALAYLREIENHYPAWYGLQTRQTLSAYALYVRDLMGDSDPNKALRLIDEAGLEKLSLDAVGWLWPVLQDAPNADARLEEIRRLVNNRVVETAGAANFTNQYDDQNYLLLGSDRRTDAILLDALMLDDPQHDLIPKLVNGLLAHRTRGRWGSTQENIFVLLSLDRYFNTFEAQTPDFVARIWLGDAYVGDHAFSGRTTERVQTDVPMAYLTGTEMGGQTQDLILQKEGAGRLYYRLGLRYAPTDLDLDPLDMGFVVRRVYEAVDNPEDVTQDADGAWHIKAGARVRVHLTMVADNRRYHVALVDPLPAGLESINPTLAVSGSVPQDPNSSESKYGWWWWGPWYEHQNLRDERAEAFTPLLWDGVYQYTYVARATTPGRFVVPPAKAEEMYSPEVFGRSAGDIVIVE